MGIKRFALEVCVLTMRTVYRYRKAKQPPSILVLRNNDLGDVVVITPLFQALRLAFPEANIVAAVGGWSTDILKNNPYISEVVECNAPWHNHCTGPKRLSKALRYIFNSQEVDRLNAREFDIGIDVVGSTFGSMLLMRLQIPIRLGRKGYAGGHTGSTAYLAATNKMSVARNATGFVGLLKSDARTDFGSKPQLFLDASETEDAEKDWQSIQKPGSKSNSRIVIAPGAGTPDKRWPVENFTELVRRMPNDSCGCVLGSKADLPLGEEIVRGLLGWSNRCGTASIRQSMALISTAHLVICHSSFVMHLAAAFSKPCIVILPKWLEPESHAASWEVEGIHHHLIPRSNEEQVRVADVENQASLLLQSSLIGSSDRRF